MLKISSTPINAQLDTSDRGRLRIFIGPWVVANCLKNLKTRWWRVFSLSIATEYTRALGLPTGKKRTEWLIQAKVGGGAVPKYTVCKYVFFSFFLRGTRSWYLSKYFRYTLYNFILMPGTTFHIHTNSKWNFIFTLSQELRPWKAKCRHRIYNLLISRHSPKFIFPIIVVLLVIFHNDLPGPYIGEIS